MNVDVAKSINGCYVRLTEERWRHITIGHPEMADYYFEILEVIESPDVIYAGHRDANIAVKNYQESFRKVFVVIYKETNPKDGFIITAYLSKRIDELKKRKILWKPHQ